MEIQEFSSKVSEDKKPFPLKNLLQLYIKMRGREQFYNFYDKFDVLVSWLGPIEFPPMPEFPVISVFALDELEDLANVFWRNRHHSIDIPKHIIYYTLLEIYHGPEIAAAIALHAIEKASMSQKVTAL